ncbi:MAG: hypothetical protein ACK4HF_04155 [Paracoccaceae bacterium]
MYIHLSGGVMVKQKAQGKDKKKGSQFVIRVDKAERDAFVALCDRLDTSAAREIRRFMRELVAAHAERPQVPFVEGRNVASADPGDCAPAPGQAALPQADVVEFPEAGKPEKQHAPPKRA